MEDASMEERYFRATLRALRENMEDFKSVDLSGHDITNDKLVQLAQALKQNKTVTSMELFGLNKISPEAWKELAEALPSRLTMLELGKCELGKHGSEPLNTIFRKLKDLDQLEELDLSGNLISPDKHDLNSLCEALSKLPLTEVMLNNNQLGTEGAQTLVSCLAKNSSLSKIWLQNNGIDEAAKPSLRAKLQNLPHLTRLELGN